MGHGRLHRFKRSTAWIVSPVRCLLLLPALPIRQILRLLLMALLQLLGLLLVLLLHLLRLLRAVVALLRLLVFLLLALLQLLVFLVLPVGQLLLLLLVFPVQIGITRAFNMLRLMLRQFAGVRRIPRTRTLSAWLSLVRHRLRMILSARLSRLDNAAA